MGLRLWLFVAGETYPARRDDLFQGPWAATMTTLDASRLLVAAAASSFVKDSVETLEEFGSLKPIGSDKPLRGSVTKDLQPRIALEKYLAEMMQRLIDEREQLSSAYRRPPQDPPPIGSIALRLMSVVSASSKNFPRLAIVRRFARSGVSAVSFASPKWSTPVSNVTEYVLQLPGVGLTLLWHFRLSDICKEHVTVRTLSGWRSCEEVEDRLPDGRHAWLWWRS